VSALLLCITFTLWIHIVKGHFRSVGNSLRVLLGFRTWVGYMDAQNSDFSNLPHLKKGILNPGVHLPEKHISPDRIKEINVVYAKDYKAFNDLLIITRNFRKI